jgi:hypothetical protein
MSFKDKFNAKKALAESKDFIPEAMKFQQEQRSKFGDDGDDESLMSKSKRESSFTFIGEGDQSTGNNDDDTISNNDDDTISNKDAVDDEMLRYKKAYYTKHGSSSGGSDSEWEAYQQGLKDIRAKYN